MNDNDVIRPLTYISNSKPLIVLSKPENYNKLTNTQISCKVIASIKIYYQYFKRIDDFLKIEL